MFDKYYNLLKMEAVKMGYQVKLIDSRYVSSCGHLTKHINISKKNGEIKAIFEFAHELGHCVQFKRRWNKLNGDKEKIKEFYRNRDKHKYKFLIDELEAWLLGYPILRRNKIDTKGFWKHVVHCWKSHLLKTKPNTVKG